MRLSSLLLQLSLSCIGCTYVLQGLWVRGHSIDESNLPPRSSSRASEHEAFLKQYQQQICLPAPVDKICGYSIIPVAAVFFFMLFILFTQLCTSPKKAKEQTKAKESDEEEKKKTIQEESTKKEIPQKGSEGKTSTKSSGQDDKKKK